MTDVRKLGQLLLFILLLACGAFQIAESAPQVLTIRVKDAITPASAAYINRTIKIANSQKADMVLIELDTPGGLVDATKDIIDTILASEVPVAVYVSPEGARASSAGTFITVAAHVAAMAPTTNIGSATPISSEGKDLDRKVTSALAAYMQTLAEKRGRNAEWAVKSVRAGESVTANQALKLKVIDFIADSRDDLLKKSDGKTVVIAGNRKVTIKSDKADMQPVPMRPQEKLMSILANPNVLAILFLIAIYGIIGEVSNPGSIFPGVVGSVALLLGLYGANVLPLNIVGVALIGLAVILFIVDTQVPSHGILTGGGIVSMALGLFLLVDSDDPLFRTSLSLVIGASLMSGLFFVAIVGAGLRAQKRKVVTGHEGLVGRTTVARSDIGDTGSIYLEGAWWNARTLGDTIPAGERVQVVAVQGLWLTVTAVTDSKKQGGS